jgi:hypothetical protein
MVGMGAMFLDKAMTLPTTAKNQANTHQSRMGGGGTPMVATTTARCNMTGGKTIIDQMMIAGGSLTINGEGDPVRWITGSGIHNAMITQDMTESKWKAVDLLSKIASMAIHAMMGAVLFMMSGAIGVAEGVGATEAHPHMKGHTKLVVHAMPLAPKKQSVLFR